MKIIVKGIAMRRFWLSLMLSCMLACTTHVSTTSAQILTVTIIPPVLPVYEQPPIPAPGYIWTPGYWAYGDEGYYWVPGTWVEPPQTGLLWTPGYWAWRDGSYAWNAGYWGPHIGFYGGINYGYGYGGFGYEGGSWNNGVFSYNRTVNNFGSVTITNVYSRTIVSNTTVTNTSFNGGTGGTVARPTPEEQAAGREPHVAATPVQAQHQQTASTNRSLLSSQNGGHPAIAATSKPNEFSGAGVVAAREAKPGPAGAAPGPAPMGTKPMETRAPAAATANAPQRPNGRAPRRNAVTARPNTPIHTGTATANHPPDPAATPPNPAAAATVAPKPQVVVRPPGRPRPPPRQMAVNHSAPHPAPRPAAPKPKTPPPEH